MNKFSHVPPGFRFHPTDEELVDYYLRKKVSSKRIDVDVIKDIDLYNIEPWDLQEKCRVGVEKQNEWYFFSHKGKKYPTGTRTNRATTSGFWKATGRDKPIYKKHNLVGMRKTLVFYKGRAPNGQKLDWIMHEYRLETNENGHPQEEGWVVCRVFRKRETTNQRASNNGSLCWYDEQASIMPEPDMEVHHNPYSCKKEMELHYHLPHDQFLQLPQLESPKLPDYNYQGITLQFSSLVPELQPYHSIVHRHPTTSVCNADQDIDQVTDWRVLDKFVASQLSHEGVSKGNNYPNIDASADKEETVAEYATSTSTSSYQVDLWK